uniref:Uncharacterized protein n=1 Tax=Amphimedon queenslandica TaxID=400682 RepID=A0A1X7UEG5_AMPQE
MLESAYQNFTTHYKEDYCKCHQLLGLLVSFIRFLEGYFIILVTKRKPQVIIITMTTGSSPHSVTNIDGHILYKIEDTAMHCLSAPNGRPAHPDESKYVTIFQNVDFLSSSYFRFIWNENLQENLESFVQSSRILQYVDSCHKSRQRKTAKLFVAFARLEHLEEDITHLRKHPEKYCKYGEDKAASSDVTKAKEPQKKQMTIQESNDLSKVLRQLVQLALDRSRTNCTNWHKHLVLNELGQPVTQSLCYRYKKETKLFRIFLDWPLVT